MFKTLSRRNLPFDGSGMSRRLFCLGLLTQAACTSGIPGEKPPSYEGFVDHGIPIPRLKKNFIPRNMLRTEVPFDATVAPDTLIVKTAERYLYHIHSAGRATRYGIGVGRAGFAWTGSGYVGRKAIWPTWTPPREMILREPYLQEMTFPMEPGLLNPLGARSLYIYANGRDTIYRIHGTADPASIGKAVSSGCIRLLNHDIIHLYSRVETGTKILVM